MSVHQAKQAIRVANIPQDVFNTCIDDDKPAALVVTGEMERASL